MKNNIVRKLIRKIYHYSLEAIFSSDLNKLKQLNLYGRTQLVWIGEGLGRRVALRRFENIESLFLQKIIKHGDTCVDVGANIGYYSQLMASLTGASGKVIAIEPIPRNADLIRLNRHQNNASNIIEVVQCAVGDEDNITTVFSIAEVNSSLSSIKNSNDVQRSYSRVPEKRREFDVLVRTLDSIVKEYSIGKICILKIDVEGFEYAAIKGFVKTLADKKSRPNYIMAELSDEHLSGFGYSVDDVVRLLEEFSYKPYYLKNNDLMPCTKQRLTNEQNIFFKSNGLLS